MPRYGRTPSRMSRFVPSELGLRTDPGTARTSRPRSAAQRAVLSAPLLAVASTTTTASARAAMMRLRRGNRQPTGASEPPSSESTQPLSAISSRSRRCSLG